MRYRSPFARRKTVLHRRQVVFPARSLLFFVLIESQHRWRIDDPALPPEHVADLLGGHGQAPKGRGPDPILVEAQDQAEGWQRPEPFGFAREEPGKGIENRLPLLLFQLLPAPGGLPIAERLAERAAEEFDQEPILSEIAQLRRNRGAIDRQEREREPQIP